MNINLLKDPDNNNQPSFGAKLGYLAAVITTIGDILAVISAGISIEEDLASSKQDDKDKTSQEEKLTKMQNQIDELQKEVKRLQRVKK